MVEISCLGKSFLGRWLFRNIAFEVKTGEAIVFMGPSGSGKSILLKIIAGLIQPDEGKVHKRTPNLGMLFQNNALFDSLTVEENLLFPLRERIGLTGKKAKERVSRFLSSVGLKGNERLYPDEISGGMQKRLGIARALIVEPQIILYDEPTAGLDPITSKAIVDLIKALQTEKQTTVLAVTNDIQRAYQLGDAIYLLAQEKLKFGGSPDQVKTSTDPGIRQFIYGLKDGPLRSGLS